jgi:hypothetical protein
VSDHEPQVWAWKTTCGSDSLYVSCWAETRRHWSCLGLKGIGNMSIIRGPCFVRPGTPALPFDLSIPTVLANMFEPWPSVREWRLNRRGQSTWRWCMFVEEIGYTQAS